jgi:hypothetical protein
VARHQLGLVGGRQVVECFAESLVGVEADSLEDLVLEAGEAASVDEFVLEVASHASAIALS